MNAPTSTPHKHVAVIKAWADGAKIEFKARDIRAGTYAWFPVTHSQWAEDVEYRVAKPTIKYRMYLWYPSHGTPYVRPAIIAVVTDKENAADQRHRWSGFVRWVGDWQEVEV